MSQPTPEPYVDIVRKQKEKDLINVTKRTRKHIPAYVFQAHANLLERFPDSGHFLTPAFVYQTLREITKAAKAQLCADETSTIDIFGLGKLVLLRKKAYRSEDKTKQQLYLKFRHSNVFLYEIRRHHGTATPAELKTLEKSDNYMKELQTKREKFLREREMKRKGELDELDPSNYLSQFSGVLELN
jgi:hypothetical protein